VALGDSRHLRERTRATIEQFVSFIFAPLFLRRIGLKVDFVAQFDLVLIPYGAGHRHPGQGSRLRSGRTDDGLGRREAWALGFGMNARGAMEIILGLLALKYGLIGERLFVALVVMACHFIDEWAAAAARAALKKPRRFTDFLSDPHLCQPSAGAHTYGGGGRTGKAAAEVAGWMRARSSTAS